MTILSYNNYNELTGQNKTGNESVATHVDHNHLEHVYMIKAHVTGWGPLGTLVCFRRKKSFGIFFDISYF